jgi:hypothetical protein
LSIPKNKLKLEHHAGIEPASRPWKSRTQPICQWCEIGAVSGNRTPPSTLAMSNSTDKPIPLTDNKYFRKNVFCQAESLFIDVEVNNLILPLNHLMKTKICKKCNFLFPLSQKVNGNRVHLYHRVFCLKCSPYGSHNTVDLSGYTPNKQTIDGIPHKSCRICKQLKPLTEFYSKSEWGRRFAVCGKCTREKNTRRRIEFKQWAVDYKGGKCEMCGYNKCLRSLDFHHINPKEKDYEISHNFKKLRELVIKELDKCQLLCRNCHGEVHDD